jgi:hypothetical protein
MRGIWDRGFGLNGSQNLSKPHSWKQRVAPSVESRVEYLVRNSPHKTGSGPLIRISSEVIMSRLRTMITVAFFATIAVNAQPQTDVDKDKLAIKQAALDYAEGYYEGSGERMQRAVHPLLFKRGLVTVSPQGEPFLVFMNSEMLIDAARGGRGKIDPDKRNISFEVLDLNQNTATARIFTVQFNDYLHLAKIDGQWRIVNVLWQPPAQQPAANMVKQREEVTKTLTEYREAANAKDGDRIKRLIHPEIIRRTVAPAPSGGKMILQDIMGETIGQIVRMGRGAAGKDQPQPEISILDTYENMATAKISAPAFVDYVHLAKQGGVWRIINILRANLTPPAAPPK